MDYPVISFDDSDDDEITAINMGQQHSGKTEIYQFETVGEKLQLSIEFPDSSRILAAKGRRKKRIEMQTKTKIKVLMVDSNIITIRGDTKENIITAKERLDRILINESSKPHYTHFLSVSFAEGDIKSSYLRFRDEILGDAETFGELHESLFYKPEKLHLTIAMLVLPNVEQEVKAVEHLQLCKQKIIDTVLKDCKRLVVKVCGVDIMKNRPTATNVLYGKVESEELQQIANDMARYFATCELSQLERENVKLHVTLINTRKSRQHRSFDATKILENYKDFDFGSLVVDEIHVSQLFDTSENGYYKSLGILRV